jgi:hypothetical protein
MLGLKMASKYRNMSLWIRKKNKALLDYSLSLYLINGSENKGDALLKNDKFQ